MGASPKRGGKKKKNIGCLTQRIVLEGNDYLKMILLERTFWGTSDSFIATLILSTDSSYD